MANLREANLAREILMLELPFMNKPSYITMQVQRIRFIGLTVTDAEKAKNFYRQALSFKTVSDITVEVGLISAE